jgi:hypothetical protein
LPIVGFVVGAVMLISALDAGDGVLDALGYARYGVMPWCIWGLAIAWMRRSSGMYHPPVTDVPLDRGRRIRAIAVLVVFCLIATPVPFRPVL